MAPYREAHREQLRERLDALMQERQLILQPRIQAFITEMERIRGSRARLNKMLKESSDGDEQRLSNCIDALDERIDSLWEKRRPIERQEEALKEKCTAIRDERRRQKEKI